MPVKSGNHEDAEQQPDGTWICKSCGAESRSYELFEEAGAYEGCIKAAPGSGSDPGMVKPHPLYDSIKSAREWDELARKTQTVNKAYEEMYKVIKKMNEDNRKMVADLKYVKTQEELDED